MKESYCTASWVADPKSKCLTRLQTDLEANQNPKLRIKRWMKLNLDLGLSMTSFTRIGPLSHHILIYLT